MNKKMILCVACMCNFMALAEVSVNVFRKYKRNDIAFCSCIYASVTFETAAGAGFKRIYGIDRDEVLVDHMYKVMQKCIDYWKFRLDDYKAFYGDPSKDISACINSFNEPITFVLSSCFPAAEGNCVNTILEELEQIKMHPIKTHVIMVEYIQYAGTRQFGNVTLEAVKSKILEINPGYNFAFETGGHLMREPNALLVAWIP